MVSGHVPPAIEAAKFRKSSRVCRVGAGQIKTEIKALEIRSDVVDIRIPAVELSVRCELSRLRACRSDLQRLSLHKWSFFPARRWDVEKNAEEQTVMKQNFADRLSAALESTRQTVANLNEALSHKKTTDKPTPIEAVPGPACPDEDKSA